MKIALAGDVMLGRLVNEALQTRAPEYPWGDVLPLLRASDLNLINLECAITSCEKAVPKVFNFRSDPKNIQVLKTARIDVVNLANNHVLDFGVEGLSETLRLLDEAGIRRVGAGHDLNEARQPVVLERKGMRVGILGMTDNEPGWAATPDAAGIKFVEVGDVSAVEEPVAALRQQCDVLIVSMHWGPNMREQPSAKFVHFAHALIDRGVDIFHGHSAHIVQRVERYKQGLILYDTGDFIDDYAVDPQLRNDLSFLYVIDVAPDHELKLELVPVKISNFQVNLAQGQEKEGCLRRQRALCASAVYEVLESTSELRLRVYGKDKKKVFENAVFAMFDSLNPTFVEGGRRQSRKVVAKGIDSETLFVNFLSEVLYLSDKYHEAYTEVQIETLGEGSLSASLLGAPIRGFEEGEIKAVTHHELHFASENGIQHVDIIFDI